MRNQKTTWVVHSFLRSLSKKYIFSNVHQLLKEKRIIANNERHGNYQHRFVSTIFVCLHTCEDNAMSLLLGCFVHYITLFIQN
jgi:hypothetical protein